MCGLLNFCTELLIEGPNVEEFEDQSPARVCVSLQGQTTSTSQPITVNFTPMMKNVTSPAQAATGKKT